MGDRRRRAGRRARQTGGREGAGERDGAGGRDEAGRSELAARFDEVVAPLDADPTWQRRVRSVRRRHRLTWLGNWTLRCFAEVGCWFAGVPAQRCTAGPLVRREVR